MKRPLSITALAIALAILLLPMFSTIHGQNSPSPNRVTTFTYVSDDLFVQAPEGIGCRVINRDSVPHNSRCVIYQNASPRVVVFDSGNQPVSPGSVSAHSINLPFNGYTVSEYQVEITTDSRLLVVGVKIGQGCGTYPCIPPRLEVQQGELATFVNVMGDGRSD